MFFNDYFCKIHFQTPLRKVRFFFKSQFYILTLQNVLTVPFPSLWKICYFKNWHIQICFIRPSEESRIWWLKIRLCCRWIISGSLFLRNSKRREALKVEQKLSICKRNWHLSRDLHLEGGLPLCTNRKRKRPKSLETGIHSAKWSEMKSLSHVRLFATPWTVAF